MTLQDDITRRLSRHDDSPSGDRKLAESVVRTMTFEDMKEYATRYVTEQTNIIRRMQARQVEGCSTTRIRNEPRLTNEERKSLQDDRRRSREQSELTRQRLERENPDDPRFAPKNSERYKTWKVQWDAECAQRVEERRLEEEKHGGSVGYALHLLDTGIKGLIEEARRDAQLELTTALLESTFRIGDGRRPTWGSATVQDHLDCVNQLMGTAHGTVRQIKMHEAAVKLIGSLPGVACLNELKSAA